MLLAITPPRTGERTLLGVENLLGSIAVPEPFSLEMAGDAGGVTLMARCIDREVVRGQIAVRYPQARIVEVPAEDDPLRAREGEQAWEMTLRAGGPEYVPLRTFRDDDLLDPGSDPLMAIIGALSEMNEGERVVTRLLLRSLGPDWAEVHQVRVHGKSAQGPRPAQSPEQPASGGAEGLKMAVLGLGALAALRGYYWIRDGETWKAVLLGLGLVAALAVGGWAWARWRGSRDRVFDPLLVREKVSRIAFDAEIRVTAILPGRGSAERARALLGPVEAAYRHYDHPAGGAPQGRQDSAGPSDDGTPSRRSRPVRHPEHPRASGRWHRCGTRRARGTRRRWWSGPGRRCCCHHRAG